MAAVTVDSDLVRLDPTTAALGNMPRCPALDDITAGMVVHLVDGEATPCDARSAATYKTAYGIALNNAQADQSVTIATAGDVILNNTGPLVQGKMYFAGNQNDGGSGGIVPESDLGAADLRQLLGVAISTNVLRLHIWNTGTTQ